MRRVRNVLLAAAGLAVQAYSAPLCFAGAEGPFNCPSGADRAVRRALSDRVREEVLDQRNPIEVHTSTHGATTLQFPAKLQGIEGDGFTAKPDEVPGDFLISRGPNWVSVKALKPDAEQNLNVVIDGRVYPIVLVTESQNDFSVLFTLSGHGLSGARPAPRKAATPARILGLIDKLKGYPTFATLAPAMYTDMDVNEGPALDKSAAENDQVKARIVRVLRDGGLDALAFEVNLTNKTADDYRYDPKAFGVRIGKVVYAALTGDGAGKVPAHAEQTAFFVVAGGEDSSEPADLSAFNDFQLVLR
jgi:hypothetical protein